jgi:hypothetical protein
MMMLSVLRGQYAREHFQTAELTCHAVLVLMRVCCCLVPVLWAAGPAVCWSSLLMVLRLPMR